MNVSQWHRSPSSNTCFWWCSSVLRPSASPWNNSLRLIVSIELSQGAVLCGIRGRLYTEKMVSTPLAWPRRLQPMENSPRRGSCPFLGSQIDFPFTESFLHGASPNRTMARYTQVTLGTARLHFGVIFSCMLLSKHPTGPLREALQGFFD